MKEATNSESEYSAGFRTVQQEGGGLIKITMVDPAGVGSLIMDSYDGDAEAQAIVQVVALAVGRIMSAAETGDPKICLCCPSEIEGMGFSVGLARAACDGPTKAFAFGVCQKCSRDRASLPVRAAVALRAVWPDLRVIEVQDHSPGHA